MKTILAIGSVMVATSGYVTAQTHQAIDLSHMDNSVRPQDDFYNFVNGNWMKTVEIPSDRARWGSFDELREHTDQAVMKILQESLTQQFEKGSDGQKIGDLYKSFVDFDTRNNLGINPVKPYLDKLDAIQNMNDLYNYLVEVGPEGNNPLFGGYVYAHMENSDVDAVYLGGASLGLGRSYYQKVDEKITETLAQYSEFVSSLYTFTGQKTFDLKGPKIVAFEKELAANLLTIEEQRDAQKRYNPVAVADLGKMVKNIDIAKYLKQIGFTADTVIIGELKYYQNLDNILTAENLPLIKEF